MRKLDFGIVGGVALAVLAFAAGRATLAADEGSKAPQTENPAQKAGEPPVASDKKALSRVAVVDVGGKAHDICLLGDRAYVATEDGLTVLDIGNLDSPRKLGSVSVPGTNQGVVVKGKRAFLANRSNGLIVVDVSDNSSPKVVTSKPVASCWAVAMKDDVLYALSVQGMLHIFDVTDPASPKQVGAFGLHTWRPADLGYKSATPEEEAAFMEQLRTNTSHPRRYKTGVSVTGDKMVVVDWDFGWFYLYDVTAPAKPVFKGIHFTPCLIQGRIYGDWIFGLGAYSHYSGFYSVPLAHLTPDKPTKYYKCPEGNYVPAPSSVDMGGMGISESGKHAFWYGGKMGDFQVIDISDPGKMKAVASDRIPGHAVGLVGILGVVSRGDYIFVSAGLKGVVVYKFPGL